MIAAWRSANLASLLLAAAISIVPARSGAADPALTPRGCRSSFTLLTYNLAGVPHGARNAPRRRFPAIARLTRPYDLVLNQEVFAAASKLTGEMAEKQGVAGIGVWGAPGKMVLKALLWPIPLFVADFWPPVGSGLYTFVDRWLISGAGDLAADEVESEAYRKCHGYFAHAHDCFGRKGYLRVGITAPGDVAIDVYNTHLDAGNDDGSRDARMAQLRQLACAIDARDSGRPVIVAGDLNLAYARAGDGEALTLFREHLGLTDSGAAPRDPRWRERDHILYRDGANARLVVERFGEVAEFTRDGYALSDHPALLAEFRAEPTAGEHRDTPSPRQRFDCPRTNGAGER